MGLDEIYTSDNAKSNDWVDKVFKEINDFNGENPENDNVEQDVLKNGLLNDAVKLAFKWKEEEINEVLKKVDSIINDKLESNPDADVDDLMTLKIEFTTLKYQDVEEINEDTFNELHSKESLSDKEMKKVIKYAIEMNWSSLELPNLKSITFVQWDDLLDVLERNIPSLDDDTLELREPEPE